jgi:DNA invertase Pin-like site-specific DNA recombinase
VTVQKEADRPLSEEERKQIFLTLVQAQDQAGVVQSRKEIVKQFGISDRQVRKIEQEGIDKDWPPLGE